MSCKKVSRQLLAKLFIRYYKSHYLLLLVYSTMNLFTIISSLFCVCFYATIECLFGCGVLRHSHIFHLCCAAGFRKLIWHYYPSEGKVFGCLSHSLFFLARDSCVPLELPTTIIIISVVFAAIRQEDVCCYYCCYCRFCSG